MSKTDVITLADCRDTYNFRMGDRVELIMGATGDVRVATRWERCLLRVQSGWHSVTRWWRPRSVVTEVDPSCGTVSISVQRWSWTKWRWL